MFSVDQVRLTNQQQADIAKAQQMWNSATSDAERASAHALAESIRNSAGYYSNTDGSYAGELPKSSGSSYEDIINRVQDVSQQTTAKAQQLAKEQWDFNAAEAQKNRDWQEYMSNTSLQRMVADAKRAGINPIFLAGNGGASTPSGATASGASASPDTSVNSVFGAYLSSLISSATAINQANINAKTNLAISQINAESASRVASQYTGMERYLTENYPNNVWNLVSQLVGGTENAKELVKGIISDLIPDNNNLSDKKGSTWDNFVLNPKNWSK